MHDEGRPDAVLPESGASVSPIARYDELTRIPLFTPMRAAPGAR